MISETGMAQENTTTTKKKTKVFIVDDHPIVRQGLIQLINQESDFVICGDVGDIPSAMKDIAKHRPDVVIIDIALGQANGIRLIEDIANKFPGILMIALSMHDESVYGERCLKAGARGYLMKQEEPENVITALKKVISGEVYISENLRDMFLNKFINKKQTTPNTSISSLSNRELEVFQLFGQGLKTQQIAGELNLSVKTIETHVEHIKRKMNFGNLHELTTHAIRWAVSQNIM
jgi:DNA-binding NarL/FixJ family response regulator